MCPNNFEFGVVHMLPWSEDEERWLYRPISSTRLAKYLTGRSAEAIQRRRAILGIKLGRDLKGKIGDYIEDYRSK